MRFILFRQRPLYNYRTGFITSFLLCSVAAFGQTPSCAVTSNANLVHQEGLAERVGDLNLSCTGGQAGNNVAATLFVSLNTNITNRLDLNGLPQGITVTANAGSGAVATGSVSLSSATTLSVSSVNYTVPATPASPVTITVAGIRAAVASLSNGSAPSVISATVQGVGAQFPGSQPVNVAISGPSLLQSLLNNGVPCNGSPLPATTDFAGFSSAVTSSTVRFTEASAAAFAARKTGDDSGVRMLFSLTGYGSGARLFVPDVIVGSSGTTPTSAGAFGISAAGGTYTPGAGQLLMIRVQGADANGAGGTLAAQQPVAATTFSTMSEITLTAGSASAVYEVVDGNPATMESAQFPAFVSVSATNCPSTLTPAIAAKLAPVSTLGIAASADPIPRFITTPPVSDCTQLNDCNATYLPGLTVDTTAIVLTGSTGGNKQSARITVGNKGPGAVYYSASVDYQSGSNWLTLSPSTGVNNGVIQAIADPAILQPGIYKATITVSAGNYGSSRVPVTFTVGNQGVTISNVGNAASYEFGKVAPGSYAVLFGVNLAGKNVAVSFNGLQATLVYTGANQINLIVPQGLGGQLGAAVIATVDGSVSNTFKVDLVPNAPGIFDPGVINVADGTVNDANHRVKRGDFFSIYLTGLNNFVPGQVTVNIGGLTGLVPSFAGAHPTLPALDQVNIMMPQLPGGALPSFLPLQVCAPGPGGQPVCSNQINLYIQ